MEFGPGSQSFPKFLIAISTQRKYTFMNSDLGNSYNCDQTTKFAASADLFFCRQPGGSGRTTSAMRARCVLWAYFGSTRSGDLPLCAITLQDEDLAS